MMAGGIGWGFVWMLLVAMLLIALIVSLSVRERGRMR